MMLWLLGVKSLWMLLFFVPLYGFFYGGQTPIMAGLIGFYFGQKPLATLIGASVATGMLAGTTGPIFAGFIYDEFGSYYAAFLTASGVWALGALLAFLLRKPAKFDKVLHQKLT
jgi:MFS family permease